MSQLLEIANMVVNYRVSMSSVLWMIIYSMPFFLQFTIPMSVMVTVLLTLLKLSFENEIIALTSSGIRISTLVPPIFLLCMIGCLCTGVMTLFGDPWGRLSTKKMVHELAKANVTIGLKERVFVDTFKDMVIYIGNIDINQGELKNIFIEDHRNPKTMSTVTAPLGNLIHSKDKYMLVLRLFNGSIIQTDMNRQEVHSIYFSTYEIHLDFTEAEAALKKVTKTRKEMSLKELSDYINAFPQKNREYFTAKVKWHEKFAIPFACFSLAFVSFPLGIQQLTRKKTARLGLGLVFFILYYIMLSAGWTLGETNMLPPLIALWMPNGVTMCIGLCLFKFLK